MKIGIEIECVLNSSHLGKEKNRNLMIGSYHSGIMFLNDWSAEHDSSLSSDSNFGSPLIAELVSKPAKSFKGFLEMLEEFKGFFSGDDNLELSEIMVFNNSCGSHVHFEFKENKLISNILPFEALVELRETFKALILNSNIASRSEIVSHYNRGSYAQTLKRQNSLARKSVQTHTEFNFQSEYAKKGLEWRGINMKGIKTWVEFFEFWGIVIKCLKKIQKMIRKYVLNINDLMLDSENMNRLINKKDSAKFKIRRKKEISTHIIKLSELCV